ncbi:MAG: AAA family ATPase [Deltaproteobacteria bacterium]|nr:AAA family ATPase [Deltaproteobacteria bacterium]
MTGSLSTRHAEQVTATVLFADLVGFSRLSEEGGTELAYLAVTNLLRQLDEIARKHGGSVDKYLGDKLMAVFGTPIHLEQPVRAAALAALEMRQCVRDHDYQQDHQQYHDRTAGPIVPFGVHIGINTGELVNGDVRGPVIREFHVLGDAVNVAARINAKAPDGEIWVGPRTYEEIKEDFRWETIGPLRLKGKSKPISAFALRESSDSAGSASADERADSTLAEDTAATTREPLNQEEARILVREALGDQADDETIELVLGHGGLDRESLLRAAFLAPALRSQREQHADLGQRTTDAERRRAAIVFADISGFTAMTEKVGAERAYPVVAACLEILDEVTRAYGGTVDHFLGDCAMALFGIPHAIEDAPRAALNAAIEMRRRILAFNQSHDLAVPIDLHTGVATGLGIAGDISGPMLREFAVMGDHVDRADLLTDAAETGSIRVDEATRHATREVFRFEEAEAMVLPGSSLSQATWELLSTTPQLHRTRAAAGRQVSSELVGRDEQLNKLRDGLSALLRGTGGVINISAEAGIGKSRLLVELRTLEEADGSSWMEGRALSNGRNLRYHPFADMLRSWVHVGDEDDDARARELLDEAVAAVLPQAVEEVAPLLANLMGAALGEEELDRLAGIAGDAAGKIVRGAMVQLLRAVAAEQPLVIVMEDLHWADLSSIELIESLYRLAEENPILFVNAFRPGFAESSGRLLAFIREQMPAHQIELELQPLDSGAARTMVKNLFRGGDVPQTTRRVIEERAHGNPFYMEEVVRSLVDTGAVEIRDGSLYATDKLASAPIPGTVQEAVMARVDRLDLRLKSVLQAASVIGGSFHVDVLEELSDHSVLATNLELLEAGEFIVPSDRSAGVEYAFKHPLIQELTYESLLESRRRELHLDVAMAAEKRLSDGIPGYCAMLAYHFSMGRSAERAENYLFLAGDEAARSAASNEALHFFRQASALYEQIHPDGGDVEKRARLEKNLGLALMNRGRLIEAVDHFDRTTRLLGHSAPRGSLAMGFGFVANLVSVLGRLYAGRPHGKRQATDRDRELMDTMFRRAMAQSTTNPIHFFVDSTAMLRALSRFDPYSVPESAAMFSGVIAIFSFGGISFDIGRRFLEVARELAEGGALEERALYYRTLCFLHNLLAGDWSEEHSIEQGALDEGLREGRFWETSTYLDLDCQRQTTQGNFDAAWTRIAQLTEIADLYEYDLAGSARLAQTAFVHIERREFDDALHALEVYYDEHSEVLFNVTAVSMGARVHALRGDAEIAAEEIDRAEALMTKAGRVPPFHAGNVYSARHLVDVLALENVAKASAARGTGTPAFKAAAKRARASRKAALSSANRAAWRKPEALRLAGREAWLLGRQKDAIDWWEQAVDCATTLGARPELGRTLADAGRSLADARTESTLRGRDARSCLREAREIFEDLSLAVDLAQASEPV